MNGLQINLNPVKKRSCEKISTRQSESFPLTQNLLAFMEAKGYEIKTQNLAKTAGNHFLSFR